MCIALIFPQTETVGRLESHIQNLIKELKNSLISYLGSFSRHLRSIFIRPVALLLQRGKLNYLSLQHIRR
jgi:hypothetical protein